MCVHACLYRIAITLDPEHGVALSNHLMYKQVFPILLPSKYVEIPIIPIPVLAQGGKIVGMRCSFSVQQEDCDV